MQHPQKKEFVLYKKIQMGQEKRKCCVKYCYIRTSAFHCQISFDSCHLNFRDTKSR
jgi:hypothetical protein